MLQIQISIIAAALLSILHNPQNKSKVRNTMLTIYRTIKAIYADDEEFR
jgi:hypothetical protein